MHDAETTAAQVIDVASVAVPVADQDRAVRFYVENLGFEVRLDVPTPDGRRWVQVATPGGRVAVTLVAGGDPSAVALDTGITLATNDADHDHEALRAAGVDLDEVLRWPGTPAMFAFRDQDGNGLKIVESSSGPATGATTGTTRSRTARNHSSPERSRRVRLNGSQDRATLE